MDGFDQRLNTQSGTEVERLGRFARDGVDIPRNLDGFQIVEANLMARCHTEQAIGRVIGAGFDPAETLTAFGVGGAEVVQNVEMFLTEGKRALGAVNLKIMLQMNKYLTSPFYVYNNTIVCYGETDAVMMGLYQGDLQQYLTNFER